MNALYDCINHVFWKSRIDLPTKKSEVNALIDFINHRNYPQNSIITADRGYESYNLIAHCIENNQFVFVPSTSVFDYLDACNPFYNLSFGIVRFKIADDKYETLVSNLDENEFKLDDFKDLYHLRWNEETAFYYLKHAVGMLYFHCRKRQHIQ